MGSGAAQKPEGPDGRAHRRADRPELQGCCWRGLAGGASSDVRSDEHRHFRDPPDPPSARAASQGLRRVRTRLRTWPAARDSCPVGSSGLHTVRQMLKWSASGGNVAATRPLRGHHLGPLFQQQNGTSALARGTNQRVRGGGNPGLLTAGPAPGTWSVDTPESQRGPPGPPPGAPDPGPVQGDL